MLIFKFFKSKISSHFFARSLSTTIFGNVCRDTPSQVFWRQDGIIQDVLNRDLKYF